MSILIPSHDIDESFYQDLLRSVFFNHQIYKEESTWYPFWFPKALGVCLDLETWYHV